MRKGEGTIARIGQRTRERKIGKEEGRKERQEHAKIDGEGQVTREEGGNIARRDRDGERDKEKESKQEIPREERIHTRARARARDREEGE